MSYHGAMSTKPLPKLTRKQAAFVQALVDNPKMSATKAVQKTYNVASYGAARNIASENLAKPNVMAWLHSKADEAEHAVFEVMERNRPMATVPANGALVLASANSILDRVHGKATQRVDVTTNSISLNIDLSGMLGDVTGPSTGPDA